MKTNYILQLLLVIILVTVVVKNASAQTFQGNEETFRVTAYQKNKNKVVSVSNEVKVTPTAVFYIPSAFTPNGDGLNETFGIIGEGIVEYNLQIFNRWGNLIFESNDVNVQWDGSYKNEKVPMDTYVYKIIGKGITANGAGHKQINENGTVTVVL